MSVAVAKVDELTRQLEDLRQGQGNEPPSAPALELEKLRRELMVSLLTRTKEHPVQYKI